LIIGVALLIMVALAVEDEIITWEKRHLDDKFHSECACFGDITIRTRTLT
jgi:hypothetical protein